MSVETLEGKAFILLRVTLHQTETQEHHDDH